MAEETLPEREVIDAAWKREDGRGQPQPILYLDTVSATDFARTYKQQTFDLIGARAGAHLLEVGSGTGEDAVALARKVGPSGRVVAVDRNPAMVAEGLRRARAAGVRVEFRFGDAHQLDLPDASFDACRSDRVFQHLSAPERALAEMVRVTRPGGRVLITEPDWETLVVDSPHRSVTRRILQHTTDHAVPQGWIGRRLPAMFKQAGLDEVEVTAGVFILQSFTAADRIWGLERHADRAREAGAIVDEELETWIADLRDRERQGLFFSSAVGFVVCGRVPQTPPTC